MSRRRDAVDATARLITTQDEPTNHLDVMNVKWVKDYIKSLTNVTCIMVSHDSGADSASHALRFLNLNLGTMASS